MSNLSKILESDQVVLSPYKLDAELYGFCSLYEFINLLSPISTSSSQLDHFSSTDTILTSAADSACSQSGLEFLTSAYTEDDIANLANNGYLPAFYLVSVYFDSFFEKLKLLATEKMFVVIDYQNLSLPIQLFIDRLSQFYDVSHGQRCLLTKSIQEVDQPLFVGSVMENDQIELYGLFYNIPVIRNEANSIASSAFYLQLEAFLNLIESPSLELAHTFVDMTYPDEVLHSKKSFGIAKKVYECFMSKDLSDLELPEHLVFIKDVGKFFNGKSYSHALLEYLLNFSSIFNSAPAHKIQIFKSAVHTFNEIESLPFIKSDSKIILISEIDKYWIKSKRIYTFNPNALNRYPVLKEKSEIIECSLIGKVKT